MSSLFTIPNILGFFRIISAPLVALLVLEGNYQAAFWLFVVAGLSDAIDGPIARRMKIANRFGLFLDPIADKLLVNAAYLSVAFAGLLPLWVALLVFSRDALIAACFAVSTLTAREVVVDPVRLSKANTGLQILLVALVLGGVAFDLPLANVIGVLSAVVAVTTTLSGLIYFARWLDSFSKGRLK
ncbi:MAG: CDP-alcohol phosphatidyltransferase family protein [Proteobacteria bacterium]|nr:CDP-alcohol phosphatidyltransferase family protein [Pseudomonadota bacterium]